MHVRRWNDIKEIPFVVVVVDCMPNLSCFIAALVDRRKLIMLRYT